MAFRFRRSVRIAPGLRMNFGKRGVSLSAGVRGASVTLGSRGVYGNVGIPGPGFSVRNRLDSPRAAHARGTTTTGVKVSIDDDGRIQITDDNGNDLPPKILRSFKQRPRRVSMSLRHLDR